MVEALLRISETLLGEHAAYPVKESKKKKKVVGLSKKKQAILANLTKKSVLDLLGIIPSGLIWWKNHYTALSPHWSKAEWAFAESFKYGPSKWSKKAKEWLKDQEESTVPTYAPPEIERRRRRYSAHQLGILKSLKKKSVQDYLNTVVDWEMLAPGFDEDDWALAEGIKYGPSKWSKVTKSWLVAMNTNYQLLLEEKPPKKVKVALPIEKAQLKMWYKQKWFSVKPEHWDQLFKKWKKKDWDLALQHWEQLEVIKKGISDDVSDWYDKNYEILEEIAKKELKKKKPSEKLVIPVFQLKNWYKKLWGHEYAPKLWNELFKGWKSKDWDFAAEHYDITESGELPLTGAVQKWWAKQLKQLHKKKAILEAIEKTVLKPKKPPKITPPKPPAEVDKDSCMIHLLEYRDQMHGLMFQIQQARFPKPHEIPPGVSPVLAHTYIPTAIYNKFEGMGYDALQLAKKCDGDTVPPIEELYDRVYKFTLETPIVEKFSTALGGKVPHYETTHATMLKKFKRFPWMDPEVKGLGLDMDKLLQRIHDAAMTHAAATGKLGGCELLIPKEQLQKVEGWVAKFCIGVTKSHAQKGKAKVWAPNRVGIKLNNHETTMMLTEAADETGQVLGYNVDVFDWKEGFPGHHWYRGKMVGDVLRKKWGWKCKTYENTTQCEGFLPIEQEKEISGLSAFMCALNNTDLLQRKCQDHVGPIVWEECQEAAEKHPTDLYKRVRIIDATAQYKLCKAAGIKGKPDQKEKGGFAAGNDIEFKKIPKFKEQIKGG